MSQEVSLEILSEYTKHVDIFFFMNTEYQKNNAEAINKYGIEFYMNRDCATIYDVITLRNNGLNLSQMQEIIDQGIGLDAFIADSNVVKFINTFGINNVIRLNEESDDLFNSKENTINFELKKISEIYNSMENNKEYDGEVSYENFVEEIGKIIKKSREDRKIIDGIKKISKKVKEKIPEEFLTKEEIKMKIPQLEIQPLVIDEAVGRFNRGKISADFIQEHPEIIPALQNKNLNNVIYIQGKIKTGEKTVDVLVLDKNKSTINNTMASERRPEIISKDINIAEYIATSYGNYVLLDFCKKYGPFFDNSKILVTGEENLEQLKEIVENAVCESIKTETQYSHENMDDEFKIKHPEMFLDYQVDEKIKDLFYNKNLDIQDLKNPETRKALEGKSLELGVGKYFARHYEIKCLYEQLTREEFYYLVDEYGRYLETLGDDIWAIYGETTLDYLKKEIEENIEKKILNGQTQIDDEAPTFFREKYPQYFIDGLNKNERTRYYDFAGNASLVEFYKFYNELPKESKKAFEGKDISINFPISRGYTNGKNYKEFFETFSMEEILGELSNYGKALDKIVTAKKVDILKKSYDKYGKIVLEAPELICALSEEQLDNVNFANYLDLVKKSNFHLNTEYTQTNAERLVAKMYLFLGYDNTVEFFRLPEMSKEELVRAIEEREKEFDQACDVRFSLKGDIQIVAELFRKLDLTKYQNGDKKKSLEILKNINENLENGFDESLEELFEDSIIKVGQTPDMEEITALGRNLNNILTTQKMEKLNPMLMNDLNSELTATGPNRKILTDILINELRKNLAQNCNLDKEMLLDSLNKEIIEKTKLDGTPFYSPQVRNHFSEIEKIVTTFSENEEVKIITEYSVIDAIKSEKEKIGKGWIRKVQNIPTELSLEEIENLEQKLYGTEDEEKSIEFEKRVVVRNRAQIDGKENPEENAYNLFKNLENPLILTMSKAEIIFDKIKPPYSSEFVKFFVANRKEILQNPEFYTNVSKLHENFDELIESAEVKNRYAKGMINVEQMFELLENNDVPYGIERDGDWELTPLARKTSLDTRQFEIAQKILQKMQEREYQTVPTPNKKTVGKYRGRILRSDDPLHIVVGEIATCCQHIGGYGETSMLHSCLEKNGSLFVVEELDEFGNVVNTVAQSWTWRNNDIVCFDNVEIPDTLIHQLSSKDYEEITKVYQETAQSIIKTDAKMMKKLLDEGRITQEQYDLLVVREVRVGLGCNNLEPLNQKGRFEIPTQPILPIEMGKRYPEYRDSQGVGQEELYTDARSSRVLAKIEKLSSEIEVMPDLSKKVDRSKDNLQEILVGYDKSRDVINHNNKKVNIDDIKAINRIKKEKNVESKERFKGIETRGDFAEYLSVEESQIRLLRSRDEDWYILSTETDECIQIEDTARLVLKRENEDKTGLTDKISALEMATNMYNIILEADKKDKSLIIVTEYDDSNINFNSLEEKGIISVSKGSKKRVVTILDRKKLEEEIKNMNEILEKQNELLVIQGINKKQEGENPSQEENDEIR